MSDPQDKAEALDEEELPEELIPEGFIKPEKWDEGAGADEDGASDVGQDREESLNAEDAAMHVERGISEG
jgi:hypothetical protein